MLDVEFGEGVSIIEPLRTLLKTSPVLCATDARLVLLEQYETFYGIYNHTTGDPNRSMANIAMHYAENVSDGSLLDERIAQFAEKKITKYFGLSFKEFLEYPPDVCFKMLEVAEKQSKIESDATTSVLNQLNNQAGDR